VKVDPLFNVSPFQAYADALLVIPKVLAQNAGLDPQETIVKLQQEFASSGLPVGIDLQTGESLRKKVSCGSASST